MVYINVIANISILCDCASWAPPPFMDDIGIVASKDMLAIDKASLDLVNEHYGAGDTFAKESGTSGNSQIDYGYSIGLGNRHYILINTDEEKNE
ncbi:MAG TPA: hypothetical protein ENG70_05945 [Candidatus Cloacimonetes bacterium]|nr:hypothetical protein [Candidatus Cloacimonadota bacterium]HEX38373.1 hypothetical protein [Candidatus Cloacimonadota bacterium]